MLAIDLCAGSGWAVACSLLGIQELGIEIMPEAIATRDVMGAVTQDISISDLPDSFCAQAPLQIAGPPCQTFSVAGNGEGRRALAEVLNRVHWLAVTGNLIRGGSGDPRTWLVLEPLRLALGGMPRYIVWEQVPSVLPVWEACGRVLTTAGYSVWTGMLHSEQYGVPQTRKRAFLIARLDGIPSAPPPVTHSRYHNRTPERMDAGVLPWVSMAQALGWGTTGRPSFTVTGGGSATGGAEPFGRAARDSLLAYRSSALPNATIRDLDQPAPTVMFGRAAGDVEWVQRSNYSGDGANTVPSPVPGSPPRGARGLHEPSATITGRVPHWAVSTGTNSEMVRPDGNTPWQNRTKKYERDVNLPAPTIVGERTAQWRTHPAGERDSPTQSIRVSVAEAAALQTFPPGHLFQGGSGKQYLQVGNAVPPLLAWHILRMFL